MQRDDKLKFVGLSDVGYRDTISCDDLCYWSVLGRELGGLRGAQWLRMVLARGTEMKLSLSNKKLGGYLLGFFLLLGIATIASTTVQAQYPGYDPYRRDRRDDRYRDDRYRNNSYGFERARQQGYGYGLSVGAGDAQRGRSFDPQRSHYWKDATEGYDRSFGNKGQYKQVFRDAFAQGYREGFQRYGYNRRGDNGRGQYGRWPR